jgi:hypothetical protein
MAGGLLNLVAYGNQNVMLTGNPTKTLFKCAYAKYTNFGLQKFRIDYDGLRTMKIDSASHFSFEVPRYADLLMDTYLVVTLPHIWSPIVPPTTTANDNATSKWHPYEFKWIKHIGTQMIERVRFTIGGQTIQEYTGQYLYNLVERDFDASKKALYYKMTGHTPELNDPANAYGNINTYPNAYYTEDSQGPEPSIRTRKLYIPLNIWFTLAAKMAFPLASLQYNKLHIEIDLRPVRDLFVIRNIPDSNDQYSYYKKSSSTVTNEQFYRFIHPPPSAKLEDDDYTDKRTNWNADVHLISTYAFLTDEEVRVFAANPQTYLIKQAYSQTFHNITGPQKVKLETMGMVANWTWFFQRSDATLRNEWSNYTNWPYDSLPYGVVDPSEIVDNDRYTGISTLILDPGTHGDGDPSSLLITGRHQVENEKDIMTSWGLLFDGKYRENVLDAGVFNYVEKYARTSGNGPDGQYCYNFGLRTDPTDFQPTGAINLSKFKNIEFEINVLPPKLDNEAETLVVCNNDNEVVGINKSVWDIYEYTYELTVLEERYNVLTFTSGNASLMYAR